jgi:hypothetical protein
MPIRDSPRRNEQIMPDHDGRHAVYVPWLPGQHPMAPRLPPVSPASANTQRDWETDLLMWPDRRFCADDECSGRGRSRVQIVQICAEHTTTGPSGGSTLKWGRLTQPARRSCQHLDGLPAGYGGMVRAARLALACCPRTGTADAAAELAVPDADMEVSLAMPRCGPS